MWVPIESILEALPEVFWGQVGNGHLFQRSRETKSNVGGKQGSKDYWGTGNIRKQFSIVFFFFFFFFFLGGGGGGGRGPSQFISWEQGNRYPPPPRPRS